MGFNLSVPGMNQGTPYRERPQPRPAPTAPLRTTALPVPSKDPAALFATPPIDRISPPIAHTVPATQAASLTNRTVTLPSAASFFSSIETLSPPLAKHPVERIVTPTASRAIELSTQSDVSGVTKRSLMSPEAEPASSVKATPMLATSAPIQVFPGLNNNCGNDCWANSLLQMIATVPSLQRIVHELGNMIASGGDQRAKNLFTQLHELMTDRCDHTPISRANSNYFRLAIRDTLSGAERISATGQEDAAEALKLIITNYDEKIKKQTDLHFEVTRTKHFNHLPDYTDERDPSKFSPIKPGNITTEKTIDSMIMADFGLLQRTLERLHPQEISERENSLFTELMWNYFDSIRADANVASYINPITGQLSVYKQSRETIQFTTPPKEFILALKRFVPTGKILLNGTPELQKINQKAPLLAQFTLPSAYAGAEATYEVDSFICHTGSLSSGHYISYQKIEGNWYYFSDSTARVAASPEEVKEALQKSYFQHYQKLPFVDPRAFRLPSREETVAIATREALSPPAPIISIPTPAQATGRSIPATASSSSVSPLNKKKLLTEKMIQVIHDKEILEKLQKAISLGNSEEECFAIFESLRPELRNNLIAAVCLEYGKPLAEKEIQSQPGYKTDIIYGALILRKNLKALIKALEKYTSGKIKEFFAEIFSSEELKKLDPLIQATLSKDEQAMTNEFNKKDVDLKKKICQLIYQSDVMEKAQQHGLRIIFSEEISTLASGIISNAIEECNGKTLSYSLII